MHNSESVQHESQAEVQMGSSSFQTQSTRSKKDMAWEYAIQKEGVNGKKYIECTFCHKVFHGGGIHRFKQHLLRIRGDAEICSKVPSDVHEKLLSVHAENCKKIKEKSGTFEELNNLFSDDVDEVARPPLSKKRGIDVSIQKLFKHGVNDHSQPGIKAALQSKERWHETDLSIAMWFYTAGISMNAIKSLLFQVAVNKIASMGHGYTIPSYHALRVGLLKDAKKSVELIVDEYRSTWADTGCTIMGDGWTDNRQRSLINFLVYCPKGVSFIKSVDASSFISDAQTLCNLFSEIVEWVGDKNVVHIVTDNGANYKAAGRLLCEKYSSIYWSPCAAHCINLIMKDICEMPLMKLTATSGSKITIFVYNHKWTLNWLRNRPKWTEIIRPGATRFATTFIALKSLYDHKDDLEALVLSQDFKKYLKMSKGKEVKQIVCDGNFWNNALLSVRVTAPLMRLLRICDSDEKPSMGYVYEGLLRTRKAIKETFQNKKRLYKPYTDIIKARWDKMFHQNIHSISYYLNPTFQFDRINYCKKDEITQSLLSFLHKQETIGSIDAAKLYNETEAYRERSLPSFKHPLAVQMSKKLFPDKWWRLFGGSTPILQKIAIRFLSQTASSSGCERNWSTFEWIHSRKRNRLEHQRLNDLVYIHYNMRLLDRLQESKRSYDPVDYECIDKTEFWVIEEDPEGELNQEELENILEKEPIYDQDAELELLQSEDDVVELNALDEDEDE